MFHLVSIVGVILKWERKPFFEFLFPGIYFVSNEDEQERAISHECKTYVWNTNVVVFYMQMYNVCIYIKFPEHRAVCDTLFKSLF